MKYFAQDYIAFFQELAVHNNKEWFHDNKRRYENSVKKPFEKFIEAIITEIRKNDSNLVVEAKDCILRINRDIRFAKDKTPYNLHRTAFVSSGGRKDKSIPGIFIRISPEMVGIMGGCIGPDKTQLSNIRTTISKDPSTFRKLLKANDFSEKFDELKGEEMKRIPKELQPAVEKEPLILKKQFYMMAELKPSLITSEKLMSETMDHWHAMRPLNDFLTKAML